MTVWPYTVLYGKQPGEALYDGVHGCKTCALEPAAIRVGTDEFFDQPYTGAESGWILSGPIRMGWGMHLLCINSTLEQAPFTGSMRNIRFDTEPRRSRLTRCVRQCRTYQVNVP